MSETIAENRIIVLTDDPERLAMLRRKRDEYNRRYGLMAPEVSPSGTYKLHLLNSLLVHGVLDVVEAEKEFAADAWYDAAKFKTVVSVITGYNSGDLSGIIGGTGLK